MPNLTCCVVGCGNRYNVRVKDISFYCFPKVNVVAHPEYLVSKRRREEWLKRLNLMEKDLTKYSRVCSQHFVSGQPSYMFLTKDVDWAPTRNLDSNSNGMSIVERNNRSVRRQLQCTFSSTTEEDIDRDTQVQDLAVTDMEDSTVFEGNTDAVQHNTTIDDSNNFTTDPQLENQLLILRIKELENEKKILLEAVSRLQQELDEKKSESSSSCSDKETVNCANASLEFGTQCLKNRSLLTFYTRLSPNTFEGIFQSLLPLKVHNNEKTAMRKQLLITLMKLAHNFPEQDLAFRFGISTATVSRILRTWISIIHNRLFLRVVKCPDRESIKISMPMCFRQHFPDAVETIDCFETKLQKPNSLTDQVGTYSPYKSKNTAKYLIGVTPQGTISYISNGFPGRKSDKYVVIQSGYLNHILPGDVILADRGFLVEEEIASRGGKLITPAFMDKKPQLSSTSSERTRRIANVRIHVERIIGVLRNRFKIMNGPISMKFMFNYDDTVPFYDKIVRVCCVLNNLCPSVVPLD